MTSLLSSNKSKKRSGNCSPQRHRGHRDGVLFFVAVVILFLACSLHAQTNGWEELFVRANQAFKEGQYQKAVDGYEQLIQSGHQNGHLYYNLGNAYFRIGDLGEAILNYERARILIPRDADLSFNLRNAQDQMQDAIAQSHDFIRMTFFWLDSVSLNELFWSFAILNILFWTSLLTRLFFRSEWNYYLPLILVVLWLIVGLSFGLKWYQVETDDRAVILEKEVNILAGPDENDTVLFKLHEGSIVHHERSEDGWYLVSLPDKKRGWIEAEAVELITLRHVISSSQHRTEAESSTR
jgi:tetratricopeptide (TPR) repeat protein